MANSQFDVSLLKPIDEKNAAFESNLKPLDKEQGDLGSYLDNLPEPEGFFNKLPRNILIGLTHLGRNLHNTPHDISQGLEQGGKSISQAFAGLPGPNLRNENQKPFSSNLPYDPESYADVFGQKGEGTLLDNLIQKGIEHAPEIAGGRALLRAGVRKFPVSQKGAARQLKEAEKLINERGINNFQMDYPLLQETSPFLPKTHATGEMIQGVINGEYSPAFALQSQVGKHARDLAKSPLASERLLAPKAQELKKVILHEMEQALRSTGHHDIADLLKGGIEDYAKYMKFKEKALPILKKLGIPTSGLAVLGLGTRKGRKLLGKIID